jgi:hypothetical protein
MRSQIDNRDPILSNIQNIINYEYDTIHKVRYNIPFLFKDDYNLTQLKLIQAFFSSFFNEKIHDTRDFQKIVSATDDIVCIYFSNGSTCYILKKRLELLSSYFNCYFNGGFRTDYCKWNNIYFVNIDELYINQNILKICSRIIEKERIDYTFIDSTTFKNNKDQIKIFFDYFVINLNELFIEGDKKLFEKNLFGDIDVNTDTTSQNENNSDDD